MRVTVENINKSIATQYLEHNLVNRSLSISRVDAYAKDMKRNAWEFNGEAIRFNKRGELIDGQHRLAAIVKADVTVKMLVMKDIDNNISIYDRGRNRSVTDSLIISGMDKTIATTSWVAASNLHYIVQTKSRNTSDYDVRLFLNKHKETIMVLNSLNVCKNHKKSKSLLRHSFCLLAFLYAYESGEDVDKLGRFSDVCNSGFYNNISETSAIVFRNDLLAGTYSTNSPEDRRACLFRCEKALYDFCRGYQRKISYNSWDKPIYSNNEKFKEKKND